MVPNRLLATSIKNSSLASKIKKIRLGCYRSFSSTSNVQDLPSEVDVLVVGGGSVGCSTLYHLAKNGVTNSVLLEKDKLTSGTTWHTAGMLWRLRPNDIDIVLTDKTRTLNREILPKESGLDTGWIENGGLFIASNKERMDEYRRLHSLGKAFGVESYCLTPAETLDVYPIMNVDDVYGTLYSPGDGLIDPAGWCTALTRVAKTLGSRVFEDTPVLDLIVEDDPVYSYRKVTGVKTAVGDIKANCVILCSGLWGPKMLKPFGIHCPTLPAKHAYTVLDKVEGLSGPGAKNVPNIRDHDASVYIRIWGDSLAVGGYEPDPAFWENIQDDFAFGLFDLNWDQYGRHLEAAIKRVPAMVNSGVKSEVCGPISFSNDHRPMMGMVPGTRGLVVACGFDLGMMEGGGFGEQLALWALNGRPDMHLFDWDICRYSPVYAWNHEWLKQRAHECHLTMYQTTFPHDEQLSGRNLRKSPFHEYNLAAGAFFEVRNGWERPGWFSTDGVPSPVLDYDWYGAYPNTKKHENYLYRERNAFDHSFDWPKHFQMIRQECLACRNQVVMFDMTYFGKFFLTGPDAQEAADWVFANDMRKPVGATVYTTMLNKTAGIESDLTVSTIQSGEGSSIDPHIPGGSSGFYITVGGLAAEHCWRHITNAIEDKRFNVNLVNSTEMIGILSIQGPKSRDLLKKLAPNQDFSNENFPFGNNRIVNLANGKRCRMLRVSFVGELGWELHIPNETCQNILDAINSFGPEFGLKNSGYRAMESLSIEKGYRFWNSDLRMSDTPLEASMLYTTKVKTDVDFLGKDALRKRIQQKPREKLVTLTIDEKVPLWGLESVFHNGDPVGFIRRAEYAHVVEKSIGFSFLHRPDHQIVDANWIKSGSYEIESFGRRIPATVHMKSPFDPKHKRLMGEYD